MRTKERLIDKDEMRPGEKETYSWEKDRGYYKLFYSAVMGVCELSEHESALKGHTGATHHEREGKV